MNINTRNVKIIHIHYIKKSIYSLGKYLENDASYYLKYDNEIKEYIKDEENKNKLFYDVSKTIIMESIFHNVKFIVSQIDQGNNLILVNKLDNTNFKEYIFDAYYKYLSTRIIPISGNKIHPKLASYTAHIYPSEGYIFIELINVKK